MDQCDYKKTVKKVIQIHEPDVRLIKGEKNPKMPVIKEFVMYKSLQK